MSSTTNTAGTPVDANAAANASNNFSTTLKSLLAAELALFLPALDNFFTALQQPGVNTQAVAQNLAKEALAATETLPAAESTSINVGAAAAQAQLHDIIAKVSNGTVVAGQLSGDAATAAAGAAKTGGSAS